MCNLHKLFKCEPKTYKLYNDLSKQNDSKGKFPLPTSFHAISAVKAFIKQAQSINQTSPLSFHFYSEAKLKDGTYKDINYFGKSYKEVTTTGTVFHHLLIVPENVTIKSDDIFSSYVNKVFIRQTHPALKKYDKITGVANKQLKSLGIDIPSSMDMLDTNDDLFFKPVEYIEHSSGSYFSMDKGNFTPPPRPPVNPTTMFGYQSRNYAQPKPPKSFEMCHIGGTNNIISLTSNLDTVSPNELRLYIVPIGKDFVIKNK